MFLWFAGLSFVSVWAVFRSPAVDYRVVMAGSVLPVAELALGRAAVLHTLAFSVAALAAVMVATRRRRLVRRRWLGIPIGLMCHLVFDGVWVDRALFWWPVYGVEFVSRPIPEVRRGMVSWLMELMGIAALVWMAHRSRLRERPRWEAFWRTGRLGRDLEGSGGYGGT